MKSWPTSLVVLFISSSAALYTNKQALPAQHPLVDDDGAVPKPLEGGTKFPHFNCTGKIDGDYKHPCYCERYMSCIAQEHAFERSCALNVDKPLHFVWWSGPDPQSARCDYPEVAGCRIKNPPANINCPNHNPSSPGGDDGGDGGGGGGGDGGDDGDDDDYDKIL
ncbi:hypothetical protein ABW20_dc0109907 [Dactylellina cionopaga]|nr:hypothetical protein ABW20_dc0109907 [Dactylellina cionopaga]